MFDFLKKLFTSATDSPTEQNGSQLTEQSGGAEQVDVMELKSKSTRSRAQKPPRRV